MYGLTSREKPREKRSKALFGTKDALDIFGAISHDDFAPPALFTIRDVHLHFFDPSAVDPSSLRRNLAKLEALGEIERLPVERAAFTYQRRADSPFWGMIKEMVSQEVDSTLDS